MQGDGWATEAALGQVVLIDEPVEAGDVIGHVGLAGPDRRPQVHFEIFAATEITAAIDPTAFVVVDGTAGGRFCTSKDILGSIDIAPRDGALSRRELLNFFSATSDRTVFSCLS